MHALLTGASGFVGSHLAHRLQDAGHKVTALVRNAESAPEGCAVLVHELGSGPIASHEKDRLEKLDAVVNLAQSRIYRNFPEDAATMFRVNVGGTQEVLDLAAQCGVSTFCQISTGTVYEPFSEAMTEGAKLAPKSALGATKLAAETIARPYSNLFALSTLRLFAPYGPGQVQRLIPELIRRVTNGIAVDLPEKGPGMKFSLAHVDDICKVIETSVKQGWDQTLNVAAQESLTIEQAACAIAQALGVEPIFNRKDIPSPTLVPDLSTLGSIYDMSNFRKFENGIVDTLKRTSDSANAAR